MVGKVFQNYISCFETLFISFGFIWFLQLRKITQFSVSLFHYPWSSTLFSSNDQRLRYSSQFSTRIILDPKYLDIAFFDDETFDCNQVFQNSGLVDFMSLKLPHYHELVRVFYNNLIIQDSTLYSEVHGIPLVIDQSLFFSLTKLPS